MGFEVVRRHTVQKKGAAVFQGLGLHPSLFLFKQGGEKMGRGAKAIALNMRQKNASRNVLLLDVFIETILHSFVIFYVGSQRLLR